MTYTVNYLGHWTTYTPEVFPEGAPDNALFCRRESDGVDWYEFRTRPDAFAPGTLMALLDPRGGDLVTCSVTWDRRAVPLDFHVVEIGGVDPAEEKPWKLFEGRLFDLATGTFRDPPPAPILRVSSAQAQTALYNAKPNGALLDQVEQIVDTYPYRPVKIFFRSANDWERSNPYVQAIAHEVGLIKINPDGSEDRTAFDALFEAASKI